MMRDFSALDRFLDKISGDVLPELTWGHAVEITRSSIDGMSALGWMRPGLRVLDIGCGQGLALEMFRARGLAPIGICLGSDIDICRQQGFEVYEMDQNFMTFADGSFDLLWCRHVLEHSIAPYFTLSEYHRLLSLGGYAYIEVPAPDTISRHELHPNHYSILPRTSWEGLFRRAGFEVVNATVVTLTLSQGEDQYWCFFLSKLA